MATSERSRSRNNVLLGVAGALGVMVPTAVQQIPDPLVRSLVAGLLIAVALLLANRTTPELERVTPLPPLALCPVWGCRHPVAVHAAGCLVKGCRCDLTADDFAGRNREPDTLPDGKRPG